MTCKKCTKVPKYDYMDAAVYMAFSADHLLTKMTKVLKTLKYDHQTKDNHLIATIPHFELFLNELLDGDFFNALELKNISFLPLEKGETIHFEMFERTKNLSYWLQVPARRSFLEVLEREAIQTLFQPILRASDLQIFGYEALSRGLCADGRLMSATELFSSAKSLDLICTLDRQCREQAVLNASKKGIANHIFINFMPTAIIDPDECLKSTLKTIVDSKLDPEKIIFEVVKSEETEHFSHLKKILNIYKDNGFKTALDDVGTHASIIETHQALKSKYVKMTTEVVRHIDHRPENQACFNQIMNLKYNHGVAIIAKGVETEAEYKYLKAHGVDFVQGCYFGKPE